jgi:cytochrome c oxidase cbb3-type subunit III
MKKSHCHPERSDGSGSPGPRGRSFATLRMTMAILLLLPAGCERENRRYDDAPREAITPRLSELQPGPTLILAKSEEGVYDDNAWGTTEGKRLFNWMNCSGCHANGGGGMGPALMDDVWIYGAEPEQIYHTIIEGRPNGMPSFKDRLTPQQVWQIVAYVRSLSGLTPKGARSPRDDHMMGKPAEAQTPNAKPVRSKNVQSPPPPAE